MLLGVIAAFIILIDQARVTLTERAACCVLTRKSNGIAFGQQGSECKASAVAQSNPLPLSNIFDLVSSKRATVL